MNEYTNYGTLSVVFYNKFRNVYDERKQYNYACNPDALQYVNEGDVIEINTPSGINKVKVVDKYWSLTTNVSKEITYNITSGHFKEKFNQFNPKNKKEKESKMKTGTKYSMTPPENKTMGTKNIMIIKSMFEGTGGNNMMQNMMMMQMMSGDEMDEKKMMMLMMMQNQGGDATNPMVNMLPMLMMMK